MSSRNAAYATTRAVNEPCWERCQRCRSCMSATVSPSGDGGRQDWRSGSSTLKLRTGPGPVSAVSKRTVTTPRPDPHTQPRPWTACSTSMPGAQAWVVCFAPAVDGASASRSPSGSSSSSVLPNRSSWIQSASPETPTPSRRTPPVVSRSWSRPTRQPGDRRRGVGGGAEGGGAVEGGEVVQPHLDRDRAAGEPAGPEPLGDAARLAGQQGRHQLAVGEVGVVGALDADRLGLALRHDRAVVARVGQRVQAVALGGPEQPDQLVLPGRLQVGDGVDAHPPEPLGGGRADAGDDRDVHRPQQVDLGAGRYDDQAVGLVEVAGHLGDELRGADPDRRRQPAGHLGDLLAQPLGEGGDGRDLEVVEVRGGEVDERLVQRQRLHERRGRPQHGHHLLAGRAVGVEAAAQERRVRAPRPRLAGRHGRADAVLPGFVRRRGDHAAPADAAHDDRLAAQGRLVALLDRGEERVEVEVEDRGDVPQRLASPVTARPTPRPIIEIPPTAPIASPRRGERMNHERSWLAMTAHVLSETDADREGQQAEQQHLELHLPDSAVDELAGAPRPGSCTPWGWTPRRRTPAGSPRLHVIGRPAPAPSASWVRNSLRCRHGLDAEVHQVRRAGELEHLEDHDRLLHDHAEPERHQHHDGEQAQGVAGDARQRHPAAVGEGPADHETTLGPGMAIRMRAARPKVRTWSWVSTRSR